MSADLAAITERHERAQRWHVGDVVPAQRVEWTPPPRCEAQTAPLSDCQRKSDVAVSLVVDTEDAPRRRIVVCADHRPAAVAVLLTLSPRDRRAVILLDPIEGLTNV